MTHNFFNGGGEAPILSDLSYYMVTHKNIFSKDWRGGANFVGFIILHGIVKKTAWGWANIFGFILLSGTGVL